MNIETHDVRTLTDADVWVISKLLVDVWPNSKKTIETRFEQMKTMARGYRGSDAQAPRSFMIRESGKLIAHAAILPRRITTTQGDLLIAGLTRVCTDPNQRGRGLGETIVRATFDLVDDGTFPFSLFQTSPEIKPFYEKLNSCVVENPIVNSFGDDSHESPFWDRVIMRYPCTGDWPKGEIDLRGPGY